MQLIRARRKTLHDRGTLGGDEIGDRVARPREAFVACEAVLFGGEGYAVEG